MTERSSQGTTIHSLPWDDRQDTVSWGRHETILRVDLTLRGAILVDGDLGQPAVGGVSVISARRDCTEVFPQ